MRCDHCEDVWHGECFLPVLQSLRHFGTPTNQMLVQPGYFDEHGNWYRLLSLHQTLVAVMVSPEGHVYWHGKEESESTLVQRAIERHLVPIALPDGAKTRLPHALWAQFEALSPLVHIASGSLGEALIKAIIRQVITARHAKKLTDAFIKRYGPSQIHHGKRYYGFPSLETISAIPLVDLQAEGLGFKAKVIQSAVRCVLDHDLEAKCADMETEQALTCLTSIKGIGRWTAHVALCDVRAHWSCYPFEDLAVRTWARTLWPQVLWPQDPLAFSDKWQQVLETDTGVVTFYLLSCAAMASRNSSQEWYTQEALFER